MPPEVNVVVEQPFDFIGTVLVPVAAILVSSGIAVWLAASERRRQRREAIRADAAALIRSLNDWSRAQEFAGEAEIDEAHGRVQSDIAALATSLSKRDMAVADFLGYMVFRIPTASERGRVLAPLWMTTLTSEWLDGTLRARQFADALPDTSEALWNTAHPEDLELVLKGEVPRKLA